MTLAAAVSASPESKSRYLTPRRLSRRRVVQDYSEDEDQDTPDSRPPRRSITNQKHTSDYAYSAPPRLLIKSTSKVAAVANNDHTAKTKEQHSATLSSLPADVKNFTLNVAESIRTDAGASEPEATEKGQDCCTTSSPVQGMEGTQCLQLARGQAIVNGDSVPMYGNSVALETKEVTTVDPTPSELMSKDFSVHESRVLTTDENAQTNSSLSSETRAPASRQQVESHSDEPVVLESHDALPGTGTESDGSAVLSARPKRGYKRRRGLEENVFKSAHPLNHIPYSASYIKNENKRKPDSSASKGFEHPLKPIREGVEELDTLADRQIGGQARLGALDHEAPASTCDEGEIGSETEHHGQKRPSRRRSRHLTDEEQGRAEQRLASTIVEWQGRDFTAYSIPGYVQFLWETALVESNNPQAPSMFPSQVVILRNVLSELKLHRFGDIIAQTPFKGIKIRYVANAKNKAISVTVGSVRYRLGVNEKTRWIHIGILRAGENVRHSTHLQKRYGRLNLIPIQVKCGEVPPADCIAFMPEYKESACLSTDDTLRESSSDEEHLSKSAKHAFSEWRKDDQMLRWMQKDHDKSQTKSRTWWTVTSTSLDCDGFNDEFGVPSALGFDLKRIQMKIVEAMRNSEEEYPRSCQYGEDDLRQTAYTEEAGNDRWNALEASDVQFHYPESHETTSPACDDSLSLHQPKEEKDLLLEEANTIKVQEKSGSRSEGCEGSVREEETVPFRIPRKKRKLEPGSEASPNTSSVCEEVSPAFALEPREKPEAPQGVSSGWAEFSSPSTGSQSRRLKRLREDLESMHLTTDATTTTSGPLSSTTPMQSSNAVMSRECQVVARKKNGTIFFMESFRELSLDIIGRSLWWIFAIGHTSITEHLLAYHGPTILWNLRRLRRPWSSVVTEVLEDYRGRAMEDFCLNSAETVGRVDEFLAALKRNPEVRHRRLATLKFRGAVSIRSPAPIEPPPPPLPEVPVKIVQAEPDDEADYNRAICDIVGLRTALFYSKPRFHRAFHETRVTLCKCHRCRNKFKASVNVGDGRIIRDIESDSTGDVKVVREVSVDGEAGEGDPELVAELKSLAMDKIDDYVTGTRFLSGHSERTMYALRALLQKCSGDQCEMSNDVRKQLEECIDKWLVEKPPIETPHDKPKRSRRDRSGCLNEGDLDELRRCFFDDEFFPMRSAHRLNWLVRKSLYSMCSDHDWIAPILIARNEKGRAVYAAAVIYKGDFVCEYKGIFYSQYGIARAKESDYTLLGKGSFMFYFCNPLTGTKSCIDATAEQADFGPARLINHSHRQPNLEATVVVPSDDCFHDRRARLIFFASRDIRIGEELLIDYGETKPEALRQNAWLYD